MTHRAIARHRSASSTSAAPAIVWFVAADTRNARKRALRMFQNASATLSAGDAPPSVLFYEDFKISNNADGVQSAFVDMLMVAQADARVLTPGSSYSEFSWTMAGKTGDSVFVRSYNSKGPHTCYTHVRELHPFCMRPRSLEPSFEDLPATLRSLPCANAAIPLNERSRLY